MVNVHEVRFEYEKQSQVCVFCNVFSYLTAGQTIMV